MINMTDRYTLSAPVAVNAGLFSHGSRHPEHVRSPSLGSHPTRSSSSNRDSESESESKRGSEEELRVSSEQPTAATSNSLPDNSSQHAPSMAKQEQNQHNKQGQQQAELQLEVDPQQRLSGDHLLAAQSTLCYVREFLAKPNPNLGRKGPTCPFVPKSLQLDSIYLAVLPAESLSSSGNDVGSDISGCSDVLDCILLQAIQTFKALEPRTGPKASYKAIILIFPDMEPSDIPAMIDGTQKRLKPNFVEEGLMLGEFHLRNNATGLHNPHFYPLRTPYPCLAIRHMVPSDIVFLNPTEFPADVRVKMISTFLAKFGDKASNDQQTEVARALLKELSA